MEHTKEEIRLNEENERRIKVGKNTSINGNPRESNIAQYFIQYGGLEYIYERPTYAIVCFMKVDTARWAHLKENEKELERNKVTRPTPQTWDASIPPYLECDMCHRQVSGQFLNFTSHRRLCRAGLTKTREQGTPTDRGTRGRSQARHTATKQERGRSQTRHTATKQERERNRSQGGLLLNEPLADHVRNTPQTKQTNRSRSGLRGQDLIGRTSEVTGFTSSFLQRMGNLEIKTIGHSKEQDRRRKIRAALHEESERKIDVVIRDADRMSDVEVAKQFSKYREVEYIHRRHAHYTMFFQTKASADWALKEYQKARLPVKKPEPQILVSYKKEGPYKKCTICQKTVRSQKLN